ncbi:SIR2 family protein [Agrobacterium salinitolerans]|uniref:SIR2 family protein n=1 Tax=Agrobacterium salinitolerans TaxID=1183413 RepID=A0A4Z1R543_9HYPH|nr:SIR2 family protein [Agrobacterium salinitolerans]UYZ08215.1 SIR2 family protein [Agrobacterium salinitolerans]
MIDWPKPLKLDLQSRRVVVVIGSGVSKNSLGKDGVTRPPLWTEFLKLGLSRVGTKGTAHIKKAIGENDLLHACEWLKAKMDDDWEPFLRECFLTPGYIPAEIHKVIFKLDQRIYMTPNFDQIFENFVTSETNGSVTVKRFADPDVHNFLREDRMHIIKLHGSIDHPTELVFTNHDYAKARVEHAAFYDVLDACLLSHTFLLIGCGISDPDLALLLENQRFNFPNSRPHYLVTSSRISRDMAHSLRANRNLKCLTYSPENNHEELLSSLKLLVDLMDGVPAVPALPT